MGNLLTFVMHFDKNMIEIFTLDHDIKKLTKAVKNDDNDVVEYTDNKYEVDMSGNCCIMIKYCCCIQQGQDEGKYG